MQMLQWQKEAGTYIQYVDWKNIFGNRVLNRLE